jgi:hypothetical protein
MSKKTIQIPHKNEHLAEFIGVMLGDGGIYENKTVSQIRITGNSEKELKYFMNFLEPMIENLFAVLPVISCRKSEKTIVLRINSVETTKFLISCGLLSGNKVKNQVGIPQWIKNEKSLMKACLRGLIDTDGSIYRMTPQWPNLFQLSFKNNSKRLLQDVRDTFIALGFHPSKIFGNRIVLTRQKEIYMYFKDIGSNNLKYKTTAPSSRLAIS